jgi:predicted O-methyltransferase YrrM
VLEASAAAHGGREVVARQLERLRRLRPATVVEIGTRHGVMAAVLGRLAQRVVTVDLHPSPLVPAVLACAGAANVVPVAVRSNAAKALLLDSLAFDVAFLDGDHTVAGVAFDMVHTRRCGCVVFHDYGDPGFCGVTRFVDSLRRGVVVRDAPFAWWLADAAAAEAVMRDA